jgi:hypothetical protein
MIEIASNIGFEDASFRSCEIFNKTLQVYLNSWDNKTIKMTFSNTIQFMYKINSFIAGAYEKKEETSFFKDALLLRYKKIPEDHPFKLFVLIDIENNTFFEVIAEKVLVHKE